MRRVVKNCPNCGKFHSGLSYNRWCYSCEGPRQYISYKPIRRATAAVSNAIKRGILESPRGKLCTDCGGAATEYDHRDYSKPLEVEAVCHSCNKKRGPGLKVAA